MAILSLLWQKASQCLRLAEGWLCSHLACPLGQNIWIFSLSHQMLGIPQTHRGIGRSLWEKDVLFQVPVCPSVELPSSILHGRVVVVVQKAASCPPEWNRRTLSFSLCQLSPIESEACFQKSLCCS